MWKKEFALVRNPEGGEPKYFYVLEATNDSYRFQKYGFKQICNALIKDPEDNYYALDLLDEKFYEECKRGQETKAIGELQRLINYFESKPLDFTSREILAQSYDLMGVILKDEEKLKEAVEYFNKITKIHDCYPGAYWMLGECYTELNEPEKAIKSWKKRLELAPETSDVYFDIADAYEKLGKKEMAISSSYEPSPILLKPFAFPSPLSIFFLSLRGVIATWQSITYPLVAILPPSPILSLIPFL